MHGIPGGLPSSPSPTLPLCGGSREAGTSQPGGAGLPSQTSQTGEDPDKTAPLKEGN